MAAEKHDEAFYYDPEQMAQKLKEMSFDVIETESQNVYSRWYQSEDQLDVYLWFHEKENLIKQQVCFFGQLAEWNIVDGLKTGIVMEKEDPFEANKFKSFAKYDGVADKSVIHEAKKLVGFSTISRKQEMLDNYTTGVNMDKMKARDIVKKFGSHKKNKSIFQILVSKMNKWMQEDE